MGNKKECFIEILYLNNNKILIRNKSKKERDKLFHTMSDKKTHFIYLEKKQRIIFMHPIISIKKIDRLLHKKCIIEVIVEKLKELWMKMN